MTPAMGDDVAEHVRLGGPFWRNPRVADAGWPPFLKSGVCSMSVGMLHPRGRWTRGHTAVPDDSQSCTIVSRHCWWLCGRDC